MLLCVGVKFPPTERAAAGVSAGEMFRELLNPLFFVLFCSMFLTAASELAPGQWVDLALTRTVHMQGILLLVYVNALMFLMRHFAGPLVHKLSSIGVLWFSCLGASLGLVALSFADSPVTGLLAATVWGTGVCYMWPTMLATASERFPRGGALLMGLMGTAGTLSIQFVLPLMGAIFDSKKIEVAGGEAAFNALSPAGARSSARDRGADFVPRCRGTAGDFADRFRRDLVVRPVQGRFSSEKTLAKKGRRRRETYDAKFVPVTLDRISERGGAWGQLVRRFQSAARHLLPARHGADTRRSASGLESARPLPRRQRSLEEAAAPIRIASCSWAIPSPTSGSWRLSSPASHTSTAASAGRPRRRCWCACIRT